MKVFRVVADSSCLIGLSQIEQFELLKELFSEVYIPYAVYSEVVVKGKGEAGYEETESAVKSGWILKRPVSDQIGVSALSTVLGKGHGIKKNISPFTLEKSLVLQALLLCRPSGRVSFADAMVWAAGRSSESKVV